MSRLKSKIAVVSGAARGQGRSHAVTLASEGADIIAIDLCRDIETNGYPLSRPEDLEETARLVEKEGRRVYTAIADVRDRAALADAVDEGVAQLGGLDIVIANAGIAPLSKGTPIQGWVDAVDVDLLGVINLVHVSMKHLVSGASIVATGSLAAAVATLPDGGGLRQGPDDGSQPGGAGYAFAKQVVAHFINDLAVQLAPRGIRANAVHPTNVNTDMLQNSVMYGMFRPDLESPTREDAELVFPVMNAMPTPYVEPEDVSLAVLYLASDEARWVTGQQLRIDAGGYIKMAPYQGI